LGDNFSPTGEVSEGFQLISEVGMACGFLKARKFFSIGNAAKILLLMILSHMVSIASSFPAAATEPDRPTSQEATIPRTPGRPTTEEVESWRREILKTPQPRNGCFAANYPERQWREVPCKTPPHKLYLPKTVVRQVGNGPDFSAVVTGNISLAEGSFEPGTVVSTECDVACPQGICPSSPTCSGSENEYSLQLNTKPFKTAACASAPGGVEGGCLGWQQFVYSSEGGGFIQYWLLTYGPPGTACPAPRGANCLQDPVSSDGWCPFSFSSKGPVYCVVNSANSAPAPGSVITSLQSLKLTGAVAGVRAPNDFIAVTTRGGVLNSATGNNYFRDLGQHWQEAEFNVFGDGGGDQAVFGPETTVVVRTQVDNGSASAPACDDQSFTGESNNLSLVGTPADEKLSALPSIVFRESNALGTPPTCATPQGINCVEVSSSGSTSCTDAGGVPSTCATAVCPTGFTLTGGGGACAAGSSKIKSLFPLESQGSFNIACDKQGVDPQAVAICCRF
jgi:hypothetical protein